LLTHRQTNKLWQKHNLLGGGNYRILTATKSEITPCNFSARPVVQIGLSAPVLLVG